MTKINLFCQFNIDLFDASFPKKKNYLIILHGKMKIQNENPRSMTWKAKIKSIS